MPSAWFPVDRPPVTVQALPAAAAVTALAADIATRLTDAIAQRGSAVLSVSGGKSPIALFESLRTHPLAWHKVHVTLVDERCVPNDHPDSNARLVRDHLLQGLARSAHFHPMVPDGVPPLPSPAAIATMADSTLLTVGEADVLVLGMGADGHTASLFPQAPNLAEALATNCDHRCLAIALAHPPANAPYPRITQTLAQLLRARHIVLALTGADKLATLQQAWAAKTDRLPISHVLHQTMTPVALWISL